MYVYLQKFVQLGSNGRSIVKLLDLYYLGGENWVYQQSCNWLEAFQNRYQPGH